MKKIALIFGLLFIQLYAIAQEHMFNVVTFSGNPKLENGTALKNGDKIFSNQKIVLGANSYVALMHKTGKTVELKNAGTYPITDLSTKINQGNTSYAAQYSDFVVKQMTSEGLTANYSNTGSVKRDINTELKILLPTKTTVLRNTPFNFSWIIRNSEQKNGTYNMQILDINNTVIYEKEVTTNDVKEVTTNDVSLDLSQIKGLNSNGYYIVKIISNQQKNLTSQDIILVLMKSTEEQAISTEFSNLKNELKEDNAINSLVIASFYQSKGLTVYAAENLKIATEQAPEVENYKEIYSFFLRNNKLALEEK